MRSSHANAFCHSLTYNGCVWGGYRILVNPISGGSRPLGGIPTNLYLSVSTITVPSWRRGFLSWPVEYVSLCMYPLNINMPVHYMQIVESLQSLQARPTWLSWSSLMNTPPWDDDDSHWSRHQYLCIAWHNIINGNRKKHQSLLLRGIGSGPGPSSPPSCFLSWHGD